MKIKDFLARHPVFRQEEFEVFLKSRGSISKRTKESVLRYYTQTGRLQRIHRGLYLTVPVGFTSKAISVDTFLITAKLTEDAVLAYHTALELHGKAYSTFGQFYYFSTHVVRPVQFQENRFMRVSFPAALRTERQRHFSVIQIERSGQKVYVASLERTLVDVLDRPDLGGGWEEVWRSLESVEFFNIDQIIEYALLLNNATTIAKVGFYLESHRETLSVTEDHLARLRKRKPESPHYLVRKNKDSRFISTWNILVPEEILKKSWQEVA